MKGSVLGGSLLISGSCIGAGMLGLPILTGMAGFFPSLIMFTCACIFMVLTALLLVETSSHFHASAHLISMVDKTIGKWGRFVCWVTYLFLFYALLVAYMTGSGNHLTLFADSTLGLTTTDCVGTLFFTLVFGVLIYFGTRPVDFCNRGLMFVKIVVFVMLLLLGLRYVVPHHLMHIDMKYLLFSLPILVISFGFHNMIPLLNHYLDGDTKRVKKAIIYGAGLTLVFYMFWQVVALGILPVEGKSGIFASYRADVDAAQAVRTYLGLNLVGGIAQSFAFVAILTSFLAQTLSLVHFWRDGLKLKPKKRERISLCLLTLVPPLAVALIYPDLFYAAFNFSGGICAVVLFGMLPVVMVWKSRYHSQKNQKWRLFGGKPLLVVLFSFALFIFCYQLLSMCGFTLKP